MKWYKLAFKQIQPIHIGAGSYGVVNETRIFIPGWTMWGALTKAYNLQKGNKLSENQDLFKNISCFYPCFNENGEDPLFPQFKNGKFYLGDYSEDKFRAKFVDAFTSTAVNPGTNTALNESLHEVNVILPGVKRDYFEKDKNYEKQLYWVGIIGFENNKKEDFLQKGLKIYVGGDSRYGFGLVVFVKIMEIDEGFEEFNKFKSTNYIPVNKEGIESNIELLVDTVGYEGNELKVSNAVYYYVPGHDRNGLKLNKGKLD